MLYKPEKLTFKEQPDNFVLILSGKKHIARIDLKNKAWKIDKEASDKQYMKSIELFEDTAKIEGIGGIYCPGVVYPCFKSREKKDGTKIFYDYDGDSDVGSVLYEVKRDCGNKIITPRYVNYDYMRGFSELVFTGYQVSDKKSGYIKVYNNQRNMELEQIDEKKIKVFEPAKSKYTRLTDAEYAIIELNEKESCNAIMGISDVKPKTATIYNDSDKEIAKFRFYKNGQVEECYRIRNGKRTCYHHYDNTGKENTAWYIFKRMLSRNKTL